jgi:hypothetical protein
MSDRYEREIDELLHNLEGRMRREPLSRKFSRRFRPYSAGLQGALGAFLRRPPTEQFMIAAMVLVVLSFLLNIFSLGKWAGYTSILSVVLFVLGLALSLAGRHSPGYQKRWRGRELDYNSYGPSIWDQLRNWLRRRRR